MKTFNKEITREEAERLFKSKTGMMYPDTKHNRKMMASVASDCLIKMQGK